MRQIILNIKDNKVRFFLELIKNFDFVNIAKEDEVPTKDEIQENIIKGLEEVQLAEQGKKEATPLKNFLDEL